MMLIQFRVESIPDRASDRWVDCAVCSNSGIAWPQQHIFGCYPFNALILLRARRPALRQIKKGNAKQAQELPRVGRGPQPEPRLAAPEV
jgi:hypothetical protein